MERKPKAEGKPRIKKAARLTAQINAEDRAKYICEKCLALAVDDDPIVAAKILRDALKTFPTEKQQGFAGKKFLAYAATKLLWTCIHRGITPPMHLGDVMEMLLGVEPDDIGDEWDRVAFAAGHDSMADVSTTALAKAHVMTHEYEFQAGKDAPVRTRMEKPMGKPIDRSDARKKKKDPEFLKRVSEAKAAFSSEGRKREEVAQVRSEQGDARRKALRSVIEKAARETAAAKPDEPTRPLGQGYEIPPLSELHARPNGRHEAQQSPDQTLEAADRNRK